MTKVAEYNLQSLRAFLAVGATGSMTAAATRLGLTQSAVSQAIRQLEDALGTVVVDRSHRPLALTPAGQVLQRHAQPIVDEAEALTTIVRQAGSIKIPELKIGVVDSFATTAGPELIRALLKTTSRLSFRSGLAHDQAEGLLNRNLDVIVTSDAMDDLDGLERHPILTEPYLLLLSSKMATVSDDLDLKDLANSYSLIRFSARSHVGAQIERHLRRLGVKAPHLLEVDATDALVAMVGAGLGWGIATPLCLLQVRSRLEGVKALPLPGPGFVRQLHLITRSGEYGILPQKVADTACSVLREHCVPELRKLVPWLRNQFAIG
jgi:DNA-binding transcriptional LysR family regulator